MKIARGEQQTYNLISAWIGAIAGLSLFTDRSKDWAISGGMPLSHIFAGIAVLLILCLSRSGPDVKTKTSILSGALEAVFSALMFCTIQ